jgi:enterochelin esterase-like enzyme
VPPREGFDARTAYGGVFGDAAAFNSQMRLLWLSAGTAEEHFVQGLHRVVDTLRQIGVSCEIYESPGTAHDWQTWRRSLHAFAPELFHD